MTPSERKRKLVQLQTKIMQSELIAKELFNEQMDRPSWQWESATELAKIADGMTDARSLVRSIIEQKAESK